MWIRRPRDYNGSNVTREEASPRRAPRLRPYPLVKAFGTKEGPSLNDNGSFPTDVRVQGPRVSCFVAGQWRTEVRG